MDLNGGGGRQVLGAKWNGRDTLTVPEAGEILGLSRGAAYTAVKNGEIPAVWIGRRCIIPRVVVERLLDRLPAGADA